MGLKPRSRVDYSRGLPQYPKVEGRSVSEQEKRNQQYQLWMTALGAIGGGIAGIPGGPAAIAGGVVTGGVGGYMTGNQLAMADASEDAARTRADQLFADNRVDNTLMAIQMRQQVEAQNKIGFLYGRNYSSIIFTNASSRWPRMADGIILWRSLLKWKRKHGTVLHQR